MKKLEIAKKVVATVAGLGAGSIATQVIKNNSAPTSKLQVVTMTVGMVALSGLVGVAASRYTEHEFDGAVESVKKLMADIKKEETLEA